MNRRIFLRGLGGACVAAPFLGSLFDRGAQAQSAARARRLIVMFTHYGCITTRFFPKLSHGKLTGADLEPTTLRPLAPYTDKLLLPRGIRSMNEWTARLERGQGSDMHVQACGSFFTCEPVRPNSDDPFAVPTGTRFPPRPIGASLDHVIAKQLSPAQQPLLVRVAGSNDSASSAISYSAPETAYPGLSPAQLFKNLTGLYQTPVSMSPDSYQAARGKSVLDLVKDDLATLERFDMSQADRRKLEAWKALVDDTGTVMTRAQCNPDAPKALDVNDENVAKAATSSGSDDPLTRTVTDSLDAADLCSNLVVLAALCNLNPVIFVKYPANFVFRGLGLSVESHALSHRIGSAGLQGTCVEGALESLARIDDYHARKFAHLVGQLDRIEEGGGKLLDSSVAVWFQELSDGLAHNHNNLPIVQAGSGGGYFKTGWAVNVEDGAPDLSGGNSEAYCTAGSITQVNAVEPISGTDPAIANAPINKYFCNLMNALGVKAGPDGFPAIGGSAEVTHFGRYDRTEDFIGGERNPPAIHSPGEFTALRAGS